MDAKQWHFDKICVDKIDKFWHDLDNNFCIYFLETGFGFNTVWSHPHGFRIQILKSRSGFGLLKWGLSIYI